MTKWTNKSYDICAAGPQDNLSMASNTAAAAAANTVTLTHDGTNVLYLCGFTVTSLAPAATVGGTFTITGLVGGTVTYEFVESATLGGVLNINLPQPQPAVNNLTDIVLSLAAITSGAATAVSAQFYKSQY